MATWVICAGVSQSSELGEYVRSCDEAASVVFERSPVRLRGRMREDLAGACVIVGEGAGGPDPVNLAAAIAADGNASEVFLALDSTSGSMRSRAKRAGISQVITSADFAARPASVHQGQRGTRSGVPGRAAGEEALATVSERREGVPVIVFVSGRGGVGKTTLAALFAASAASWGLDVAALDLDLAFGNLAALCGVSRPGDLAALAGGIASDEALEQASVRAGEHLHVWGPCRAPEYAECIQPFAADIIARLTHGHDLVIVDTPSSWGDAVAGAAQQADRLVIVSDERPGAIPALSRCGSLAVRLGVARTRIVRLMNACDPRRRDESFVARAAVGLECAREVRVLDGGLDLVELLGAGGMAELVASENPAALGAAHGLAALLKELGHLPDAEGARHALAGGGKPRRLFGLGRGEA